MNDNKRKLYDALSQDYDLGTFEQFESDIADAGKRRKLYDATIEEYDFGDFAEFENQLGFAPQAQSAPQAEAEPQQGFFTGVKAQIADTAKQAMQKPRGGENGYTFTAEELGIEESNGNAPATPVELQYDGTKPVVPGMAKEGDIPGINMEAYNANMAKAMAEGKVLSPQETQRRYEEREAEVAARLPQANAAMSQRMQQGQTVQGAFDRAYDNYRDNYPTIEAERLTSGLFDKYAEEREDVQGKVKEAAGTYNSATKWVGAPHQYSVADPYTVASVTAKGMEADDLNLIEGFIEAAREEILTNEKLKAEAEENAEALGLELHKYVDEVAVPMLQERMYKEWIEPQEEEMKENYMGIISAFDNSIIGMLANIGRTDTEKYLKQVGQEEWRKNASLWKKAAAGAGSMIFDLPIFGGIGSLAAKPAQALGQQVFKGLAKRETARQVAKGATKEAAQRYANYAVRNGLKNRVLLNLSTAPLQSGLTFGLFDAGKTALNMSLNGEWDWSELGKSAAGGTLLGGALGVTSSVGGGLTYGLTGPAKYAGKVAEFGVENAVFTEGGRLIGKLHGEQPENGWLEDYVESGATLLMLKAPNIAKNVSRIKGDKEASEVFAFNKLEREQLGKYGEDLNAVLESLLPQSAKLYEDGLKINEGTFTEEYRRVMLDPDIAMTTKAKLMGIVEGKAMTTPRVTDAVLEGNRVMTYDPMGRLVEVKEYATEAKANAEYKKVADRAEVESIGVLEDVYMRIKGYEADELTVKEWLAKNPKVTMERVAEIVAKNSAGEKLTEAEQKILESLRQARREGLNDVRHLNDVLAGLDVDAKDVMSGLDKPIDKRTERENRAVRAYTDVLFREVKDKILEPYRRGEAKRAADDVWRAANNVKWANEDVKLLADRIYESDRQIDETANDGMVYTTTAPSGEKIIITGGKVVLDNEGYIDVNQSEGLVALMPDGTKKPVRVDELREKVEVSNAEELKAAKREEIKQEVVAEPIAESGEVAKNEVLTYEEGGETHSIEVLGDNGDGTSRIISDGQEKIIGNDLLESLRGAQGVVEVQKGENAEKVVESSPTGEAAAPVVEAPKTALEQIPRNEKNVPLYEQVDSELAWDGVVEEAGGNEETAMVAVNSMVEDKKKTLAAAEKAKAKAGATITEKIAAENERVANIEKAKADLAKWEEIAGVKAKRALAAEAESKRVADEAAARQRAEEERLRAEREAAERAEREALNGVPDMVDDKPQDARARGYRRVNGHKVDRQEPVQGLMGKEIAVKFSDSSIPTGRVAVIEAEQLQPSHIQGQRNPLHFIDEAQPKERNDAASVLSARKIAENVRPEEITSSVTAYTGAPTVNARGEAVQGNNRSAALRLMWENNPEQAAKYKQYLMDHAAEFGLNAEDVAAMKSPVLVNMLDVSDADAITLGQYVAQDTESGGTERIKPKNVMQKMGGDMRSFANKLLASNNEEASFAELVDANGVEVLKWMAQKGYITPTQYKSAFDSNGNLTAEVKNDLRDVMYQSIFKGGSTQLEEMFNALPAKAQKAILATAFRDYDSPNAERMNGEVQNSIRAYYALARDAAFANAKNYKEAKEAAMMWARQYQLDDVSGESFLPSENFSNFAIELAIVYKGWTQRNLQNHFNNIYDLVQGTKEASLFEEADNTPRTLKEAIKENFNIDYNGQSNSNSLAIDSKDGQARKRGGNGDIATGERIEGGERPADSTGGARGNGEVSSPEIPNNQIPGLKGYTTDEVLNLTKGHITDILGGDISIVDMRVIGSRSNGTNSENSDLDVLVEFDGDISEDAFFNAVNGEDALYIDGVRVDINPITKDKSGTIEQWMNRNAGYSKTEGGNAPGMKRIPTTLQEIDNAVVEETQAPVDESAPVAEVETPQATNEMQEADLENAEKGEKGQKAVEPVGEKYVDPNELSEVFIPRPIERNNANEIEPPRVTARNKDGKIRDYYVDMDMEVGEHNINGNETYPPLEVLYDEYGEEFLKEHNIDPAVLPAPGKYRLLGYNNLGFYIDFNGGEYFIPGFGAPGQVRQMIEQGNYRGLRADAMTVESVQKAEAPSQSGVPASLVKGTKWEKTGEPDKVKYSRKKGDSHDITWYIGKKKYGSTTAERDLLVVLAEDYRGDLNAVWNAYEQGKVLLSANEAAILKKLIETNTPAAELQQGVLELDRENPAFERATENVRKKLEATGVKVKVLTKEEAESELARIENAQRQVVNSRMSKLDKVSRAIMNWLKNNTRNKRFEIELPAATQRKIRKEMGRDFDTHSITANSVAHSKKNHGVGGEKNTTTSIPLRDEDFALIPYIMTAPDNVIRGSYSTDGSESVRFYKNLSNGYVVVVEKEQKNSPDDMETITMWAELSANVPNARNMRPSSTTSVTVTISPDDVAKIRKDAENAILSDTKVEKMVYGGANSNQEIFVSNARKAVEEIKQEKATPQQWLAMIKKNGGLKAGEDAWMGLSEWLENNESKSLTKQEVLDFVNENAIKIEEVEYNDDFSQRKSAYSEAIADVIGQPVGNAMYGRYYGENGYTLAISGPMKDVDATKQMLSEKYGIDIKSIEGELWEEVSKVKLPNRINSTRLDLTTEGLENKREIALVVPTIEPYNQSDEIHFGDAGDGRAVAWVRFGETTAPVKEYADFYAFQKQMQEKYYPERRVQALNDADLIKLSVEEIREFERLRKAKEQIPFNQSKERVLVIDEIQSKRHQDGREKGYEKTDANDAFETYRDKMMEKYNLPSDQIYKILANEEKEEFDRLRTAANEEFRTSSDVPSAPFEKNWQELAMKRMLRLAAEEGFDKVAWTTGEQQAERYNMSKQVERIDVEDNGVEEFSDGTLVAKNVALRTANDNVVHLYVDADGVAHGREFDGKSLAEIVGKELAEKIMQPGDFTIEGDGLRIGGEGMKGFYDKMLPSFVSKYTKKWGAKVGTVEMPSLEQNNVMHSVDVTPEMKESVMEGQPMFLRTSDGTTYGWAVNGEIYLTPEGLNPNTPIHEYTHLWAAALQKSNPKLWGEVVEAMKLSPAWNEVMADENYTDIHGDENRVASEALSRLSGNEGYRRYMEQAEKEIAAERDIVGKVQKKGILNRIKNAVSRFWNWLKGKLGSKAKAGDGTEAKAEPWDVFVNKTLKDFDEGINPDAKDSPLDRMAASEAKKESAGKSAVKNNANFVSTYKTEDGKDINYTSERAEGYGVQGYGTDSSNSRTGHSILQRQTDTGVPGGNSGLNTEKGEFCVVERVFTENGAFNFTSGEKIESADDVAYIFSALEDAAKEHSFVVYVKDGKPTVVELGMGSFNATMVDIPTASLAYSRINPDHVYFVHNHPSGNLVCSGEDVAMLRVFEDMSDVPVTGVIINLKTGKYGTFDTERHSVIGEKRVPENEERLTVHTLDKQIFAPDYDPMAQPLVRSSQDVAQFLNSQRMGDRPKVSFLILSRANRIIGNIHTPFTDITTDTEAVARYINERIIQFGGENAVLYGDFAISMDESRGFRLLQGAMERFGKTKLLDVVHVEGNFTKSAIDLGLLYEPETDYGVVKESEQGYGSTEQDIPVGEVESKPLTFAEKITNSVLEASAKNKENLALRSDALRMFGRDVANVLKLMGKQREYDKSTVDQLVKLAKMYFKDAQLLGGLTPYQVGRVMTRLNNAVGKRDITDDANELVNILVDAHNKELEKMLEKQAKTKAKKVNASGVEVIGKLDKEGQLLLEEYNAGKELDLESIDDKIIDLQNEAAEGKAEEAAARIRGLELARQYREEILAKQTEIKGLEQELKSAEQDAKDGAMDRAAYKEFRRATERAILESKLEMVDAYHGLIHGLGGDISSSAKRAKLFQQAQIDHVKEIQHNANSDLLGHPAEAQGETPDKWNSSVPRLFMSAMPTFQTMLKFFGEKAADGRGYLYERFIPQHTQASHNEYVGKTEAREKMRDKLTEIFGKKTTIENFMDMSRKEGAVLEYQEGGQKTIDLTRGQVLYLYMINKMADGQMKLSRMGITDADVQKMANELPEEFVRFADWVQEDFLTELRDKYNAVHERMFGAPMAAIESYFPIKINKRSRGEKIEPGMNAEDKPSTVTGSVIKRTKNAVAIDLSADAMQVLLGHIDDMENWAAWAEFRRDVKSLLNYRHFQNQVKGMESIRYGSGEKLWKNFVDVANIAAGSFKPSSTAADRAVRNIAKGVVSSKIAFRYFTALKQILSTPAFWSEVDFGKMMNAYLHQKEAWDWAMKNLPGFSKRWEGRASGNEILLESDADWKVWQNRAVQWLSKEGMRANAFIDALTVATGAKAVFKTKYEVFKKAGYSEERAREKALNRAAEAYNESQQSSESAYLSPLQAEATFVSSVLTAYRNSPFGYNRKMATAIANLKKKMKKGFKQESIEYMIKQLMRDGLNEEQAKKFAKSTYRRSVARDAADVALYEFFLNYVWVLGPSLIYILGGDDDEKKKELNVEAFIDGAMGGLGNLPAGETLTGAIKAIAEGDVSNFKLPQAVAMQDMETIADLMQTDPVRAAGEVLNILVAMGVGVNPQTFTDMFVALADTEDWSDPREIAMLVLRLINAPNSKLELLEADEAMENYGANIEEITREYAEYQKSKRAPLTGWLYSDESEQKAIERYEKRFKKILDERFEVVVENTDEYDMWYENSDPQMKAKLAKLRQKFLEGDKETTMEKLDSIDVTKKVLFGSGYDEVNTVYYELSTAEDEDMAMMIDAKLKELTPMMDEYKKLRGDERKAYREENLEQIQFYNRLNAHKNNVNNLKGAMKKKPEEAQEKMEKIRKIRTKAIDLINNYNE